MSSLSTETCSGFGRGQERRKLSRQAFPDEVLPVSTQRLTEAAVEAFAERGFHGTTTRDIAARAALSPAALYVHYRSKTELLYLIVREAHEEVLRRMEEAAAAAESPSERLKALVGAHVRFHAERHTAARVANHELPALSAKHRAKILALRAQIERLVDETLEEGRREGAFAIDDVRATTFLVLSIGIGVSRWFHPAGRLGAAELGDRYAELIAKMVDP